MEKIKAFYFYLKLLWFRFCSTFYRKIGSNTILLDQTSKKTVNVSLPYNFEDIKDLWLPPSWMVQYDVSNYSIEALNNVFISNDGVVFNQRSVFMNSLVYPHFKSRFGLKYRYERLRLTVKEIENPVFLVWNHWSKANYYHWMIESLGVLLMSKKLNQSITLVIDEEAPLFVLESLKAFEEVNIIRMNTNFVIKARHLFLPKYPTSSGKIDAYLVNGLRKELLKYSAKVNSVYETSSNVYVSRSRQKMRSLLNEEELLNDLKAKDFKLVYFEDYNFWDQIAIMKNATFLIAPHGANLVNMLVMKEGSTVLEFNKKDIHNATLCYWQLATALNFTYFYVPVEEIEGNFKLDEKALTLIRKYIENTKDEK